MRTPSSTITRLRPDTTLPETKNAGTRGDGDGNVSLPDLPVRACSIPERAGARRATSASGAARRRSCSATRPKFGANEPTLPHRSGVSRARGSPRGQQAPTTRSPSRSAEGRSASRSDATGVARSKPRSTRSRRSSSRSSTAAQPVAEAPTAPVGRDRRRAHDDLRAVAVRSRDAPGARRPLSQGAPRPTKSTDDDEQAQRAARRSAPRARCRVRAIPRA